MDDRIDDAVNNPLLVFVKLYQKHGVEPAIIRGSYNIYLEISISAKSFDFEKNFYFLTKISIFDKHFDF